MKSGERDLKVIFRVKWTPERAKKESEEEVKTVLASQSPLRWSRLLQESRLSSRTLKKALDRMMKKGLIYREVEAGPEYPPPVRYGLTSEGKNDVEPKIFAEAAFSLLFDPLTEKKTTRYKQFLDTMGRRIAALCLHTLLKTIAEENPDWMSEFLMNLSNLPTKQPFAHFKKEEIQKLRTLLKQIYPQEVEKLDSILKEERRTN